MARRTTGNKTWSVTSISTFFHNFDEREAVPATPHQQRRQSSRRHGSKPSRALLMATHSHRASALRTSMGRQREAEGIERYAQTYGVQVVQRNEETLHADIGFGARRLRISGRPDGVIEGRAVVEHKYRTNGLLDFVPHHEKVQCHLYMKMLNLPEARLVQSFNDQMRVDTLAFDQTLWDRICATVDLRVGASDFLFFRHG